MSVVPLELLPSPARRFIQAVRERWLKIAAFVLAVGVVTAVLAMLAKPWFAADTTLLPPAEGGDAFGNFRGLIESAALERVGLFSTATPSDVYVEILKSRLLRQKLVDKFELMKVYDLKSRTQALRELDGHLHIDVSPAGLITVRVEDPRKHLVADMANFLVVELDRFNREQLTTRGKRTRQFLESRVAEVEKRMRASEAQMTAYEQKHKVVIATDNSSVRGVSDVMARKLSLQVKRAYTESYSAPGSPVVREMDAEIAAFDRELAQFPALKNEGARIALEAEIQRKVFSYLTAQYEQARLEELRDTPTVSVLDPAVTPEYRSRPRRTIMVLTATFVAGLIALGWVALSLHRSSPA